MKIYPNNKNVVAKEVVGVSDIPLSYISSELTFDGISIDYPEFNNKKIPAKIFEKAKKNTLYFKSDTEVAVNNKDYMIDNDGFLTLKNTSKNEKHRATVFSYRYILQSEDPYKSGEPLTIKINSSKIKDLLKEAPTLPNIDILEDEDSPDIFCFKSEVEYIEQIKKKEYVDNGPPVSLIISSAVDQLIHNNFSQEVKIKDPILFHNKSYEIRPKVEMIRTDKEFELFPKITYKYIFLTDKESPFVILQDLLNFKTIILATPKGIKDKGLKELLLEHIVFAYLVRAIKYPKDSFTSYISKNDIDYFLTLSTPLNKKHLDINWKSDVKNLHGDYRLLYIDIDNPNVELDYISPDGYCHFKKTVYDEPEKGTSKTILTAQEEIRYIDQGIDSIYEIEESPKISYKIKDHEVDIFVTPMKSSSKKIFIKDDYLTTIHNLNSDHLLVVKYDEAKEQWYYEIVEDSNTNTDIVIAKILIKRKSKITPIDIRVLGGGSSSFSDPNMIDSSNINGRSYRVGTAMVITLPKQYKSHQAHLEKEIEKHISSAEVPIFLFEDSN